jgi:hypothetical protein
MELIKPKLYKADVIIAGDQNKKDSRKMSDSKNETEKIKVLNDLQKDIY